MKKTIIKLLLICLCLTLVSCKKGEVVNTSKLENTAVMYDEKFGGFFIEISIDDFNALGFTYGDSVDVVLSNDCKLEDIPYYNGYYTKTNDPLICAYPGYAYIKVTRNNGNDLYSELALNEDSKASVTLREKGKYLVVQEVMDTVYKNEREAFTSDEIFANYRVMKAGNIKENIFYRSASPIDNEYNRAKYTNDLLEKDNVNIILNLSDNKEDIEGYIAQDDFTSYYYLDLYNKGNVALLDMGSNYRSDAFKEKVVEGLRMVIENDGPYLIHCVEGKDRTGFVAMLIEALVDASYEEMLDDYMLTYDNYYQINKDNKVNQYEAIIDLKFNDMIFYLTGVDSVEKMANVDMSNKASEYLLSANMSEKEISVLIEKLTD